MQTFSDLEWLKIDIANRFGLDKLTWDKRLEWFECNESVLDHIHIVDRADKPILYKKAIRAYRDALNGVSIGHPIELDATASGLSIMAILMRCEATAKNTNLIDTGKREDIYKKIGDVMGEDRKTVKPAIMTHYYKSKAEPKKIFGNGTARLNNFYKALASELPGAEKCMDIIHSCWQSDVTHHEFIAPDGHTARIPVMDTEEKRIKCGNTSFTHRASINKPMKEGLSLVANYIHFLDSYMVREMIRKAHKQGFELITIHDAYLCLPSHVNQMRQNYLDILIDMARAPILTNFYNQMKGTDYEDEPKEVIEKFVDRLKTGEYHLS